MGQEPRSRLLAYWLVLRRSPILHERGVVDRADGLHEVDGKPVQVPGVMDTGEFPDKGERTVGRVACQGRRGSCRHGEGRQLARAAGAGITTLMLLLALGGCGTSREAGVPIGQEARSPADDSLLSRDVVPTAHDASAATLASEATATAVTLGTDSSVRFFRLVARTANVFRVTPDASYLRIAGGTFDATLQSVDGGPRYPVGGADGVGPGEFDLANKIQAVGGGPAYLFIVPASTNVFGLRVTSETPTH